MVDVKKSVWVNTPDLGARAYSAHSDLIFAWVDENKILANSIHSQWFLDGRTAALWYIPDDNDRLLFTLRWVT